MTVAEERFVNFMRQAQRAGRSETLLDVASLVAISFCCAAASFVAGELFAQLRDQGRFSALPSFGAVVTAGYVAEYLTGYDRAARWMTAGACIVAKALLLPVDSPLWLVGYAAMLALVAGLSSRRGQPHSPDQRVGQRKGFRIIRNRPPFLFAFRENVIE